MAQDELIHKGRIVYWTSNLDDDTRGKEFAAMILHIYADPKSAEESRVNLIVWGDGEHLRGDVRPLRVPYSDDPTKLNSWHWIEQQ